MLLDLVLERLQVLRGLFGIALRVGVLLAGRRLRDLLRQLGQARVLDGRLRIGQACQLLLDGADLGEHLLPVVAALAQLARQPAQLLDQRVAPRVRRVGALLLGLARDLLDALAPRRGSRREPPGDRAARRPADSATR